MCGGDSRDDVIMCIIWMTASINTSKKTTIFSVDTATDAHNSENNRQFLLINC
jgi:hypothetical protein